jgi:hypothetical protein
MYARDETAEQTREGCLHLPCLPEWLLEHEQRPRSARLEQTIEDRPRAECGSRRLQHFTNAGILDLLDG